MTTSTTPLEHLSDLVHTELNKYLKDQFVITEVRSEILPASEGEDYIRSTVILEDGHLELDPHTLNKFALHIESACAKRGFARPTIAYADKSEIPR